MNEKIYERLLLHVESLRYIITDLETTIRLAHELEPSRAINNPETTGALADAFLKMTEHIDQVLDKVVEARQRVGRMARLCHNELDFAEAERVAKGAKK